MNKTHRRRPIIEIRDARHLQVIMAHYHTVRSLQQESGRSRSWAYKAFQHLPWVEALDVSSGIRMRIVRREAVREYIRQLRRPGNPNWG